MEAVESEREFEEDVDHDEEIVQVSMMLRNTILRIAQIRIMTIMRKWRVFLPIQIMSGSSRRYMIISQHQ